jgi:hypothetical protein
MPAIDEYPDKPRPAPCTVMLKDPVVAALLRPAMLAIPAIKVTAWLNDPALPPTLTIATRLDLTPDVLRHRMEVSDSHRDDSYPDHDSPAANV